jgi:hypothetical protein
MAHDHQHMYAQVWGEIYRSSNHGVDWQATGIAINQYSNIQTDSSGQYVVSALDVYDEELFLLTTVVKKSINYGETWEETIPFNYGTMHICLSSDASLIFLEMLDWNDTFLYYTYLSEMAVTTTLPPITTTTLAPLIGYEITVLDYFKKLQPAKTNELANHISVTTQPLQLSTVLEEVFRSRDVLTLGVGASTTIEIVYTSAPVKGAVIAVTESDSVFVQIVGEPVYYPWGAYVEVNNPGATITHFKLQASGYRLSLGGQQTIVRSDNPSIVSNGLLKYTYPDNYLVQSEAQAIAIAEALLSSYKTYRKDISIDWRGNPALELGDTLRIPEYKKHGLDIQGYFRMFRNRLNFDGTLRAQTEGRKI